MPSVKRAPRNSVKDRPAAWRLALRRLRRLGKPAAWTALASVGVMLMVVLVHTASMNAASSGTLSSLREKLGRLTAVSGLRVTDIVIEGRANTPEPLLRAAIGVSKGDPILGFSVEQARQRIESLTWVDHATVERRLPGTIVVSLQERRPFAIWQDHGKLELVDRAGQLVTNQDITEFRQLPLIVGQGAPAAAAVLLDALTDRPSLAAKVSASVRVGERRWNLHMKNGIDVMLPEGHVIEALDRLMQLQQQHEVLDRPLVSIDLRLPDRLVFRPHAETKDSPASAARGVGAATTRAGGAMTVPVLAKKPT